MTFASYSKRPRYPRNTSTILRLDAEWSERHRVPEAAFYGLLCQELPTGFHRLVSERRL